MTARLLEKKVETLSREVATLRVMFLSANIPVDDEGEYKPEFVEEMLRISRKKGKDIPFTTAADFLRRIRKGKKK